VRARLVQIDAMLDDSIGDAWRLAAPNGYGNIPEND
jgi:hypothetical protein